MHERQVRELIHCSVVAYAIGFQLARKQTDANEHTARELKSARILQATAGVAMVARMHLVAGLPS